MTDMRGAGWVALVVAVTLPWSAADAAVRICKGSITGDEMQAARQEDARALALKSWTTLAELNGENYGSWRVATGRLISCRKLADGMHYCTARASPCAVQQVPPKDLKPAPRPSGKPVKEIAL